MADEDDDSLKTVLRSRVMEGADDGRSGFSPSVRVTKTAFDKRLEVNSQVSCCRQAVDEL